MKASELKNKFNFTDEEMKQIKKFMEDFHSSVITKVNNKKIY